MTRVGAGLWFAVVAASLLYLVLLLSNGVSLQSNILSLLPPAEQDHAVQDVQDRVAAGFSRRIVLMVGHADASLARGAALKLASALADSGMVSAITSNVDAEATRAMASAYFPYRTGLLSDADRAALLANDGQALVSRALALLYGPGGFANTKLLARDPFLLLSSYFLSLPTAQSRLKAEDGLLSVRDGDRAFVLVSADLSGDPYALQFQSQFNDFLSSELASLQRSAPGLSILRTGAVFYATQGASSAMNETSVIASASIAATLAMVLLVFRGLRPILLSFLAIGVGILTAFVGTVTIFGEIHTVALLFGASLIGISVDYSLEYFCEYFDPAASEPRSRLTRVLPGISIGLATSLIGYCALLLAPVPGLQQVSVFSVIGLGASFLTVVLWFPILDIRRQPKLDRQFVTIAARHWTLWEAGYLRIARGAILLACLAAGATGFWLLRVNDDVRTLQTLSADLKRQEREIMRLTGWSPGTQYLLVRGDSEQAVLETEEKLAEVLSGALRNGTLDGFTTVAQFAPSIVRQKENRELVATRLVAPYLAAYTGQIGYQGSIDYAPGARFVQPSDLPRVGPLALLATLDASDGKTHAHIVLLRGVADAAAMTSLVATLPNVLFVSLADDWSRVFGVYRRYALALLALSAALMLPVLWWRYGWVGGLRVMAPSVAAVVLAPALAALAGVTFTFFNAMALVLVLSIGIDYSVFCREASAERKPVTMLAIALAALSTIFSFGMLALSQVYAVHAFGTTMLLGIALAFLFAPAAGSGDRRKAAAR